LKYGKIKVSIRIIFYISSINCKLKLNHFNSFYEIQRLSLNICVEVFLMAKFSVSVFITLLKKFIILRNVYKCLIFYKLNHYMIFSRFY